MTNKLPVVGKRYKHKITKDIYKAFKHKARENCYFMENQSQGWDLVIPLHDFFIEFEELPEDKAETKLETQSHISELSDEVKEAMRELKQEQLRVLPTSGFYNSGVRWHSCYNDLCNKTKNLLNALDKEFSLNGHFEGLPPSKEAIERNKMQEKELYDLKNMASGVSCKADYTRKEEVKEKEFFWAAVGQLIEYQGKKYICINQTNYLPNEKAEDWKEEDHTSQWCKHTKIRFRDIFANNKTPNEETLKSFSDYEKGVGLTKYDSVEELFEDLEREDTTYNSLQEFDKKYNIDENDSFKHMDGAEELSQELMKKDIFGSGKKQVESEKKIEEEAYQALSIQNRTSIWKPVNEEVENQSIIFINKAGYARLAEAWNDKFYFIEGDAGGTDVKSHMIDKTYYVKKFCTLTDYINNIEERLRKLENK